MGSGQPYHYYPFLFGIIMNIFKAKVGLPHDHVKITPHLEVIKQANEFAIP